MDIEVHNCIVCFHTLKSKWLGNVSGAGTLKKDLKQVPCVFRIFELNVSYQIVHIRLEF